MEVASELVGPEFELKLGYSKRPMRKVADGPSPVKFKQV